MKLEDFGPIEIQGKEIDMYGPPVEVECDHGHHLVADPRAIRKFLRRKRFVCYVCKESTRLVFIDGLTVDHNSRVQGLCVVCGHALDVNEELYGE